MAAEPRRLERLALRLLTAADAACNRLYGWRANPLYQSGTIVIVLLVVLIVTGLWLIFFYRVGTPYQSVAAVASDPWLGRWIRGVHRYASDAAVVFTLVHLWRMFAQGRSWGPRALAWTSGVVALGLLFVCGLTGYVMVWDVFGQLVAQEGARMLDTLPILSEPIGRAFTGEQELAAAFFFVNLFAHIAIPLGLGLVLWLHVSRVARPTLLPPRRVTWVLIGALVVAAVVRPAPIGSAASPFQLPEAVRVDWLYAFWVPLVRATSPGTAFVVLTLAALVLLCVPLLTKRRASAPPPSVVNEDICTGCRQCSLDCPYEAITMIARPDGGRSAEVARVDPELCVSCGICAGSCAPMGVGPPGRTGRDQLAHVRAFVTSADIGAGRTVVVCCDRGARGWRDELEAEGAVVHEVDCAGNLHTSVIELLVRGGAAGVLVIACPPRDCWNREGPRWLSERIYHDREAELQPRVDRRRVRVATANASESAEAVAALRDFMVSTARLDGPLAESSSEIDMVCEPVPLEES
jgi:quinol-cytochrome oxidoreductase complex cytochrome b subunit/coenzyme F420-reducing hydrogenase delta subunit